MTDYSLKGTVENMSTEFQARLQELNQTISRSGATMEGNLFYFHQAKEFVGLPPDPKRAHKRRNFHRAVFGKAQLVEVGFNAGHSALLALSSNQRLRYVGVDIFTNAYTAACGALLKRWFGERFELIKGDSRDVLPVLATHRPDIDPDLIHVDGGHGVENCRTDICNSLRLARKSRVHLLVDDTAADFIRAVVNEFVSLGHLASENMGGTWELNENYLARIIRDK